MLPGYEKCLRCLGHGEIQVNSELMVGVHGGYIPDRCPVCSGVGSVPADATVEAVARSLLADDPPYTHPYWSDLEVGFEMVELLVRAALVAYAQHAKEET